MPKLRSLFFASTALTACAVVAGGYAQHRAEAEIRAALDGLGDARTAAVSVDIWNGRARIDGFSLRQDGFGVEIGALALPLAAPAFGLVSPAQALEASAVAENIAITAPMFSMRIPRIEAAQSSMTGAEISALFDAKTSASLAERLAKLQAASIVAPEIVVEFNAPDQKQTIIYRNVRLANVAAGKVAEATAAGATMAVANAQIGEWSGVYGVTSVKNLDLALIARIVTDKRKGATEARANVYDSFSVENYQLKDNKGEFDARIARIIGRDVKMRPLSEGVAGFMALIQKAQQAQAAGADKPAPEDRKKILAMIADIFDAVEFSGAEAQGVVFKGKDKDGNPVAVDIGRAFVGGVGGAPRLGEIGFEGLKVDAAQARFAIGSFAMRGLDYQRPLETGLKMLDAEPASAPRAVDVMPTLDQFMIGNLQADVPAPKNDGNAENGARIRMSLGKFEYKGAAFVNSIPTRASLRSDNLVFDLPTGKGGTPELREIVALGLKRVDLSTGLALAWDSAKQQMALDYDTSGPGLGALKLGIVAENIGKELFSGDAAMAQASILGAAVSKLDLSLDDSGLTGLLLAMQAKQTGKSVEQLRTEFVQVAALGIPAMLGNAPAAKALGAAVSKFLAQPKNLKVTATAKNGIGASDVLTMESPADLLSKIDVKASANQ